MSAAVYDFAVNKLDTISPVHLTYTFQRLEEWLCQIPRLESQIMT